MCPRSVSLRLLSVPLSLYSFFLLVTVSLFFYFPGGFILPLQDSPKERYPFRFLYFSRLPLRCCPSRFSTCLSFLTPISERFPSSPPSKQSFCCESFKMLSFTSPFFILGFLLLESPPPPFSLPLFSRLIPLFFLIYFLSPLFTPLRDKSCLFPLYLFTGTFSFSLGSLLRFLLSNSLIFPLVLSLLFILLNALLPPTWDSKVCGFSLKKNNSPHVSPVFLSNLPFPFPPWRFSSFF